MFQTVSRVRSAHVIAALGLASFLTSTAGQAVVPLAVQNAVEQASDADVIAPAQPEEQPQAFEHVGQGEASFYGNELAGNRTASGERFNPSALTAAHRSLPLGSKVRVTNEANGKSVIVRINDRGPFVKSRLIDVSYAAAQQISMIRSGHARVKLELIA